jgi:hypothetical protein
MALFLRTIDDFPISDVVAALRALPMSPDSAVLVKAFATATNRTMSRHELSRVMGTEDVNQQVEILGEFASAIATQLDASLEDEWESDDGEANGWMLFISHDPPRWTEATSDDDTDEFVVLMRETLARALDAAGIAEYEPLDDQAELVLSEYEGMGNDGLWAPTDPLIELSEAEESLRELSANDRSMVIAARFGQGAFRARVVEAWEGKCAVTGAGFVPALVATHIVPWSDASNEERLDAHNGLLLVGTLERLFEGGFITFESNGLIRISPLIPEEEQEPLGLSPLLALREVPAKMAPYLARHREHYFLSLESAEEE